MIAIFTLGEGTETPIGTGEDILTFCFTAKLNREESTKSTSYWKYENYLRSNLSQNTLNPFPVFLNYPHLSGYHRAVILDNVSL